MKVFEVLQENFISNLIGDVRNAFKPGIAVTPNMIAELEDGLARLERGEQPTPRQQKMMDTFLNTTMAREIKKTFGVDIEEGGMPNAADRPRDPRVIRNMPNAADRPRDPRVTSNMPNAAEEPNPVADYINALKDPNADPEWLEVLRKMANAYTGQDIDEGFGDWFKKANDPQNMQQDVVPMVKQLLDQGMSEQEVVAQVEQELGVRPRYIQQAIRMVRAGLAEGRLKSKSYRKSYKAAKASGRRRMKSLRDSVNENAQANAMLAKVDTVLQGTGFARQGFKIVKAPQQGTVRGSITDEALTMVKNMLAKAQAMGAVDGPALVDPKPIVNPTDIDDSEFEGMYETATAGSTSAGAIATVSNPSVTRNAKKPKKHKGVAPNALDSGANLMSGQVLKR